MEKKGDLPKIPRDKITPAIITGIEALGRGNDLNRLDVYLTGIAQVLGPEAINKYVNIREYMNRRASALGIDTDNLVRSEEELAQMEQMQQQQMAAQQMGPPMAQAAGRMMEQQQQAEPE